MKQIKLLDVTLRDGGYTNDWRWGKEDIDSVLDALKKSKVDVIELGFLRDEVSHDQDVALYHSITEANALLARHNIKNAAIMIELGKVDINHIPHYSETTGETKILRLTVHKGGIAQGVDYARQLIAKGYDVCFQPTAASSYDVSEYVDLVNSVKSLEHLYAFYVVDTFGSMYRSDVLLKFNIANSLLDDDIIIGWHSHNNLQLSYSLTTAIMTDPTNVAKRVLMIDASVFGIGRGAGNLNSEIIIGALNAMDDRYHVTPLFSVVNIVKKYDFGYDVPYYITAKLGLHPSYGIYIKSKYADLEEPIMYKLLKLVPDEHKIEYNQVLFEELCEEYLG